MHRYCRVMVTDDAVSKLVQSLPPDKGQLCKIVSAKSVGQLDAAGSGKGDPLDSAQLWQVLCTQRNQHHVTPT